MNLDALARADFLDNLTELELIDLYGRVRKMLTKRLTADGEAESIEMLLARLQEVTEAPKTPARRTVSPREREVLHFLALEYSNREIATTLFIAENTVKNHVRNIFEKYDVRTRHGAVLAAIRDGTLTVD